jgi:hypothetical protein
VAEGPAYVSRANGLIMALFPLIRLFPIQTGCFTRDSNTQTASLNNHVILVTTSPLYRRLHRHIFLQC